MLEGFLEIPILQGSSFMSVTDNGLNFNKNVVKHMQKVARIRLLCNPVKKQIAIQESDSSNENSIPFYRDEKNLQNGVRFNNREVQQMIATMMDWDLSQANYRVDGFLSADSKAIIFNLNNARKFDKKKKRLNNNSKSLDELSFDD